MAKTPAKKKGFENSRFDKDTKKAPEGSKADKASDKKQKAAYAKKKRK